MEHSAHPPMPDLEICEINLLRGPNVWANYPVLEAWVDLGSLNDASSDEVPGFNERLKSWLPGSVSYTHLRSPRDRTRSRMPSSA